MVSNKQFSAARHDAADVKEIVLSSGITLSAYEKQVVATKEEAFSRHEPAAYVAPRHRQRISSGGAHCKLSLLVCIYHNMKLGK